IAGIDDQQIWFSGEPGTCEGDSGGPTLIRRGDVESIAAVHSYGDAASCVGNSYDMRVDVDLLPLLDPLIATHDPGLVPPSDGANAAGAGGGGGNAGGSAGAAPTPKSGRAASASAEEGGCSTAGAEHGRMVFPIEGATVLLALARRRRRQPPSS